MPKQVVIDAMQKAKLANDCYKFKSLFVREMMDTHQSVMNETSGGVQLTYDGMKALRARQRYMTVIVRKFASFLAQQMWLCPPFATLLDRCKQKTMNYPFSVKGYVMMAVYILDKLTTPEGTES